jgi:type VI secretion system FHA domain protein
MRLVLKTVSFQSASMGGDAERVFDENGGVFGRSPSSDWVLPDPERYISSKHGQVYFQDGRYFIRDTSTNGLKIEGQAEAIGKGNSVPLSHGDVLLLGEFRLEVGLEEAGGQADPIGHPVSDVLGDSADSGSLDPLDFLLQESSSSTAEDSTWPESQADDSSLANDHFSLPGVKNDPFFPQNEQLANQEPAPLAAGEELDINKPVLDESVELIPDDWNLTDINSEPGADQEANEVLQSIDLRLAGREPSSTPNASMPRKDNPAGSWAELIDSESELQNASDSESDSQPENPRQFDINSTGGEGVGQEAADVLVQKVDDGSKQEIEQITMHEASTANTPSTDESALYEAFLQGMGILDITNTKVSVETMRSYGELLQLMIESLMELLSSRTNFKNEFRLNRTILKSVENNPLKFSPNVDEAMRILFSPASSGYLGLQESVAGGLEDMKYHQVALIAGLQAIFLEFSKVMSPERYTTDATGGVKGLLQSMTQKSRNWEQFCAYCERLEGESAGGISDYFSSVFTEAYEERIILLKNLNGGKS